MEGSEQADILDLLTGHTDDTTIMRLTFECLLAGLDDDRVVSLLNIIGWRGDFSCFAIGGEPAESLGATASAVSKAIADLGGEAPLIGTYGRYVLVCMRVQAAVSPEVACTAVSGAFSAAPLYLSPVRTGAQGAARALVQEVGLARFYAQLLPADKVARVESLRREGEGRLAFVGDGINDAPVLKLADVGIAMGAAGSDAAIEAADVVLMDDNPLKIAEGIALARNTLRIVRQNICFALGIKAAILLLGAIGYANMWAAVFADVGVTVLAVLNALRAMRYVDAADVAGGAGGADAASVARAASTADATSAEGGAGATGAASVAGAAARRN